MKRILLVSALALSAMTAVGTWLAPAAYAGSTKTCSTTTTDVTPPNGNAGFTKTTTQTQTSACNSASDTGSNTTTTCTTNKAGNCVSGH
jgi:hypothetical protein